MGVKPTNMCCLETIVDLVVADFEPICAFVARCEILFVVNNICYFSLYLISTIDLALSIQ